jgi:feruloyl esterase
MRKLEMRVVGFRSLFIVGCALSFFQAGLAELGHSQEFLNLPVIKPAISCERLAKAALGKVDAEAVSIQSATQVDTPKGHFCKVKGNIGQVTAFEVDLPIEHWSQRLVQNAFNASAIANGGTCAPALNGEFAVAFSSPGFAVGQAYASRSKELQSRIDSAYRASHLTALTAKALIRNFYGQPQRFAYFLGCSAGGLQAMNEVERFPRDFDGVSAGSPLLLNGVHNIFFHSWESYINKRADGSRILASSRMPILHQSVMEHCAQTAGVLDGVLLQPTACKFDPAWLQCLADAADTAHCLTAEEVGVVDNLYAGPGDGKGRHFEIAGFAMGSELRWGLSIADHIANPEARDGGKMKRLLAPPDSDKSVSELKDELAFNQEWFEKAIALAPLFNGANTDIRRFQQHGGKLILWHGAEDLTVQPEVSVAYYQGVQKVLGVKETDTFLRLFMIPGFGHCVGGEIPFQFDVLTPLMAWTELHRAPQKIMAGNPAGGASESIPYGGVRTPIAAPDRPNLFTRPVFPFPMMARYTGKGDPNDAANYSPARSGAPVPQMFDTEAATLFGPHNQKFYHVADGQLEPDKK